MEIKNGSVEVYKICCGCGCIVPNENIICGCGCIDFKEIEEGEYEWLKKN